MTGIGKIMIHSIKLLIIAALLSQGVMIAVDLSSGAEAGPISSLPWWSADPVDLAYIHPDSGLYDPYQLILGPIAFDPIMWEGIANDLPEASKGDEWLIQVRSPGGIDELRSLEDNDIHIVEAVSALTFMVRSDNIDAESMIEIYPWIRSITTYHPIMKISTSLYREINRRDGAGSGMLTIGLYDQTVRDDINEIIDLCVDEHQVLREDGVMTGSFLLSDVLRISSMSIVSHVSLQSYEELDNDIAADIIDVEEVWNTLGLNGSGQIVAVADGGLDTGNNATIHPDVKGRIQSAYTYGRTGNWSDPDIHVWTSSGWSFKGGHGTHVVGSVLGNGSASNGNISGMAPEAELVMQSTMASTGSLSIPAYNTLFNDAYNSGARIQTNSWSSRSSYGNYTWKSWQIDNYMWGHKNLTTLFSAGNNGAKGPYHVSTQASSKNVIAVGASESYRPTISSSANNISEIASFSSQGYTWGDNRIKPDVVAPGTYILSMRNSQLTDFWNHYWGSNSTYVGINNRYAFMGGTSMSTPIVAGMTALIRQYYMDIEGEGNPSAALIKSTVINGARPLNGSWSSIPNRYEGWGRVNLSNSLGTDDSDAGTLKYLDNQTGLKNGVTHSNLISVSSGSSDLIITLVWTDFPGSNTSSVKLVNDLDITLTTPDGKTYYGNDFISPFDSTRDRVNNVERIRIPSPAPGLYILNITGYSVSNGPQPYAVVMTGTITESVAKIEWSKGIVNADGGSVEIRLSDSNLTGEGWLNIKVNTTSDPSGEMINLTEMQQGGSSTGIFVGTVTMTMSSPGAGEVMSVSDEELRAHYIESYPERTLISSTMVLIPPIINGVDHDAVGMNLTYQDRVIVTINGTSGYSARFSVVNISALDSVIALDDGQLNDLEAGDGIYTGSFTIPNYVNGTYVLTGYMKRPELPEVMENSSVQLTINTNIPRMPANVSVETLPFGNILRVNWDDPGDPNLMNFRIYRANETFKGSGMPSDFTLIHQTPDARTSYTDRDLVDGSTYFYSLSSFNVLGFSSRRTNPVSGVPRDTMAPFLEIRSPDRDTIVRGVVEINLSFEEDSQWISINGAVDNDLNGIPDDGWIQILNTTYPIGKILWNTTDLPPGLSDGDTLILRAAGSDEAGNQNVSDPVQGISIDNTMPDLLEIDSPLTGSYAESSYRLMGTSESDARITVSRNGIPMWMYQCDESGIFQFYLALQYGINLFEVSSYDAIGNGPHTYDKILYIVYDPDDPVGIIPELDLLTSTTIVLNGSGSYDVGPESDLAGIVYYSWRILFGGEFEVYEGEEVSLEISMPGPISIELTVSDRAGNIGIVSTDDEIFDDIPPEIGIIDDLEVNEDGKFSLSPPDILDNDPDIRTSGVYLWNITGPEAYSVYGRNATFMLSTPGIYIGSLQIFDTGGNIDLRTFNITVKDITPPSARAGPDLIIIRSSFVTLNAGISTDNDPEYPGGYNFTWRIPDLGLLLYGTEVVFLADTIGVFDIRLTVTDRGGNTNNDDAYLRIVSDGEAPVLEYSLPGNGWTNVTPETDIILGFSEFLDPNTVRSGIILIDDGGMEIAVDLSIDGGGIVTMNPISSLIPGVEYSISMGSLLHDLTGTSFEAATITFTIRPDVSVHIIEVDGDEQDDIVITDRHKNISISFDHPVSDSSVITLMDSDGSMVSVEYSITESGTLEIVIPDDIENGDYTIYLSGVIGRDGGPIVGDKLLEVEVSIEADEDPGNGGGGGISIPALVLIIAIPLALLILILVGVIIIRSRRGEEGTETVDQRPETVPPVYDPSGVSTTSHDPPGGK